MGGEEGERWERREGAISGCIVQGELLAEGKVRVGVSDLLSGVIVSLCSHGLQLLRCLPHCVLCSQSHLSLLQQLLLSVLQLETKTHACMQIFW